jgi:excinuclease ABC subunit A
VKYKDKNILDILETPIEDIIEIFCDAKKVYSVLTSMMDLGLGYLKLGQMSMNLSGGEAQRIKLAKALGAPSHGHNLYILDEPTSGLNDADIEKFKNILLGLQEKKDTLLIIEHNIEFIAKVADYIIDFGLEGGQSGGKIVAQGIPQAVFTNPSSSLYDLHVL